MLGTLHQTLKAVCGIRADNHSTGTVISPAAIDTLGYHHALVVVNSGLNGSSGTAAITVTECDTVGGTYTPVTGAAFTTITEALDNNVYVGYLNLRPRKRYLKISAVIGTAACDLGVTVLLGGSDKEPVTQENTVAFNVQS